jgi:hypothetical protein
MPHFTHLTCAGDESDEGEGGGRGEGEGEGEGEGAAGGGTTSASPAATPATALSAAPVPATAVAAPSAALVPTTVPTAAPSTALVPAARAALVAAAKDAKATAEKGAVGKKAAAKAGSAAVCQELRNALQRVEGPRELLDPVDCSCAISTARRTYHELVTGRSPTTRAMPAPPEGYGLWALGLMGSDSVENALSKFISRYAAQAIVRCHAPLVPFKPSHGVQKGRLCLLMCATSSLNQLTC